MTEFVIRKTREDNSLAAVTIRREIDRIERQLEKQSPGIIAMIGMNMVIRQLHLLHHTTNESERWIDAMAEAMKKSIRESGEENAPREKG